MATGREHLARAVFEGVALAWRQIVSLLEKQYGFRATGIIAVGGGSTNPLWNRIKASVLRAPVTVLEFAETASLGAALTAGIGTGLFADAGEAREASQGLRRERTVAPDPEWVDTYASRFDTYDRLYPALKELFDNGTIDSRTGAGTAEDR